MNNEIPLMTDPLGAYWTQPSVYDIVVDDDCVLMSQSDFDKLSDYSRSQPSGVYDGKMWKSKYNNIWYLKWYGPHENPHLNIDMCTVNHREIIIT